MTFQSVGVEGKTKIIQPIAAVRSIAKPRLTAGDGARDEPMENKDVWATTTTSNVFQLLKKAEIPVAFWHQDSPVSFIAPYTRMITDEIVVRILADGSYLKRNECVSRYDRLDAPIVEHYAKTKGKKCGGVSLDCDDPYMLFEEEGVKLFNPRKPIDEENPMAKAAYEDVFTDMGDRLRAEEAEPLALKAARILERAFGTYGYQLVDVKFEFGVDQFGRLLLSDVVDNDSWRLLNPDGVDVSKEAFRQGQPMEVVSQYYQEVAELTEFFCTL